MKIKNPSIILVRPQLPENIGMSARAMNNYGLKDLILVKPRFKTWPNKIALDSAAKGIKIIENLKVFNSLEDALSTFNYAIATSSRKRFLNKPHINKFKNIFKKISYKSKTAIVFGPENSGLSNEDLMLCDNIFNIKVSNQNTSLNLSHSVILMCFKWFEYFDKSQIISNKVEDLATKKEFNFFINYLKKELNEVNFFNPKEKTKTMFHNIQTMFLRARLNKSEIRTLWGMIKKLTKQSKK